MVQFVIYTAAIALHWSHILAHSAVLCNNIGFGERGIMAYHGPKSARA